MLYYPYLLRPVSKEILWGGDRLKREYNKTAPFDKLAESWELTVRENEVCTIINGPLEGTPLDAFLATHPEALGRSCVSGDRFPLLIKFIDAADRLSIQVHPEDAYALENEGELGKTEIWYIMACEPGAKLVYGLRDGVTKEDFSAAVSENRIEETLNFVEVHPGEVYFIPAGQVHAIGAGILIAEIQQNSNVTYRVYDYNRKQADGSLRPLHTAKALDVIKIRTEDEINAIRYEVEDKEPCTSLLCSCRYFTSRRYVTDADSPAAIRVDDRSFCSLLVLDAEDATLECDNASCTLSKGQSYFIPAGLGEIRIRGKADVISSQVN